MKTNYRRLKVILDWFPDCFYLISISDYEITLQGKFNPKTTLIARSKGFTNNGIESNGYLKLTRENIVITLTD